MATPVLRKEASIARTRMELMSTCPEHNKNPTSHAKQQTHEPESALFRQRRNRGNRNRALKHGYTGRLTLMWRKSCSGSGLLAPRRRLDSGWLLFVPRSLRLLL